MVELSYEEQKEYISQLLAEITEFQASSRELESELEQELEESDKKQRDLQDQVALLTEDLETWKTKFVDSQKEHANSQASLQKQISALKEAQKEATNKLREIEMENDDMERHGRITETSLEELERKYHDSLEQIALLEAEIEGKNDLEIELQRTKDELKETKEELAVSNRKIVNLSQSRVNKENKLPKPRPVETFKTSPPKFSRLSSSKSLRRVHGMIDQMQTLQIRVDNFKSTFPKKSKSPGAGSPKFVDIDPEHKRQGGYIDPSILKTPSRRDKHKPDLNTIEGSPINREGPNRQNNHQRSLSFAQNQALQPTSPKKSRSASPKKLTQPGVAFSAIHGRNGYVT